MRPVCPHTALHASSCYRYMCPHSSSFKVRCPPPHTLSFSLSVSLSLTLSLFDSLSNSLSLSFSLFLSNSLSLSHTPSVSGDLSELHRLDLHNNLLSGKTDIVVRGHIYSSMTHTHTHTEIVYIQYTEIGAHMTQSAPPHLYTCIYMCMYICI